jgi:GT2 family glycosyltransferase
VASPGVERVTVVVVTWEAASLVSECLRSLQLQSLPHRVLVVDNASTDATAHVLATQFPEAEVLRLPRNTGFAGGVAAALEVVPGELVALLNNDAVAEPGWLQALVEELDAHPEAAAVTSCMLFAGEGRPRVNNTGVVLREDCYGADRGWDDDPAAWPEPGEVFGFSGGAALLRAGAVRAVGGFPAPFFLYYEDTDTSWRLRRAGWTVRYQPAAVVRHRHAASSDVRSASFAFHNERNRLLMLARCAGPGTCALRWTRFALTTASLATRRLFRRPVPPAQQFRVGLRLHVLASALRLLPWAVRSRRVRPPRGGAAVPAPGAPGGRPPAR